MDHLAERPANVKSLSPSNPNHRPRAATNGHATLSDDQIEAIVERVARATRPEKDARDEITVKEIVDLYLEHAAEDISPGTLKARKDTLALFVDELGEQRAAELGPLDFKVFLRRHTEWKSGWTKGRVSIDVKRLFNWALSMQLIRANPFRGIPTPKGESGRPMPDEHFRLIMRNTPASVRRFVLFLRLSGCRPSEASKLRWDHIDWQRSVAILPQHKTARATGAPRIIVIHPVLVKLLRWMQSHQRREPATLWMARILAVGDLPLADLNKHARAAGYTHREIWLAKSNLGVEFVRKGQGHDQRVSYHLPRLTKLPTNPAADRYVFLNAKRLPWSKQSLAHVIGRLRKKLGLPVGIKLYGLRHRFATEAVKAGVNLKLVALFLGHRKLSTTMGYVTAIGEDNELLHSEIQKIPQAPHKQHGPG